MFRALCARTRHRFLSRQNCKQSIKFIISMWTAKRSDNQSPLQPASNRLVTVSRRGIALAPANDCGFKKIISLRLAGNCAAQRPRDDAP
jgi:hypothetical protein